MVLLWGKQGQTSPRGPEHLRDTNNVIHQLREAPAIHKHLCLFSGLCKIHRSVLCWKTETSKGVNQCQRNKDQVTSLPQKQSFVIRTGLFCFARQRRHAHAVLFQTPSLSSVPTASIFHMQQINFTFSAGISSRDQPTS